MSNEILVLIEIIAVFSLVLTAKKIFGEVGLLVWIPVAAITANIETLKNVNMFGVETTLGSVMFGSIFLATDILSECYSEREARKGILLGFFFSVLFILCSQMTLIYKAGALDFIDASMRQIFIVDFRVVSASLVMFFIANMADIFLYEKLREKTKGRYIWLRNNIATIICNCLENFLFVFLGFYGIYDFLQCLEIAYSVSLVEVIVSICDTPFLYLALR